MGTKSASMTVRGIDEITSSALRERACRDGVSVNALTLRIIKEGLGLEKKKRITVYDDLDRLAGTWSVEDAAEFERAVSIFEKVDEDLWK